MDHLIRIASTLLVITLLALPNGAEPPGPSLIVEASPLANLIYQLDCISGANRNCSQGAYLGLWKSQLELTAEDQDELSAWKALRTKYSGQIELNEPKPAAMSLPWNGQTGLQLEEELSIASFNARDLPSLRKQWEAMTEPADASKLESIVRHFQTGFQAWWERGAGGETAKYRDDLERILDGSALQETLRSFARFYAADFSGAYPIYFDLIYRPANGDTHTHGTQMENHAVMEFIPGDDQRKRLTVAIHELCHFLYSSSPRGQKRKLTEAFADSPDRFSLAGWGLLNEALASALGNGIAAERLLEPGPYAAELRKPLSLYNDPAIDGAAKALIPFLTSWLRESKTIYDPSFAPAYLGTLERSMTALLQMPARLLSEVAILYDSEFADAVEHSFRPELSGGIYLFDGVGKRDSWQMLETYSRYNALVFVSPTSLPQLEAYGSLVPASDLEKMEQAAARKSSWVYAIQRFPSTYLFVVGGRSGADAAEGFHKLLGAKQRFTGLLVP